MAFRGERFRLDLDSDSDEATPSPQAAVPGLAFIRDIAERPTTSARPPSPPKLKSSRAGFPARHTHAKPSVFRQGRCPDMSASQHVSHSGPPSLGQISASSASTELKLERKRIDQENQHLLAQMSSQEIEEGRRELLSGLNPSLIQLLLRRANIDEGRTDTGIEPPGDNPAAPSSSEGTSLAEHRRASILEQEDAATTALGSTKPATKDANAAPVINPPKFPASRTPPPLVSGFHFPQAPPVPSLDPSDPNFLQSLHSKYFPDLPVDPSKLAWMAPIPTEDSPADRESPYNPSQNTLAASSIRFDFQGRLIPPRLARQIPATKGLHHHGLAPEAAGYTVPELARLSRSSFPAQRCMAYQTLGRILFRLGKGDFGNEEEELYRGLWTCLDEGRVLDTLVTEAGKEDGVGNRSCKATATEAVWLWQKGGGKKWRAK